MDLWIRSQNKYSLTKVNNLYLNDSNDYLSINTDLGEYGIIELGEYKTKERALEVLDEIWNILKQTQYVKINGFEATQLLKIYEMPEE